MACVGSYLTLARASELRLGDRPQHLARTRHGMRHRNFFQAAGDECRPSGLMAGAMPTPGVTVEVLVKEHEIAPVRALREPNLITVARATARGVWQKDS